MKTPNAWVPGLAALGLAIQAAVAVPPFMDGVLDAGYPFPLFIQDNYTGFGDNSDASAGSANGSELDAGYGFIESGVLHLFLAGNLENNGNQLELFLDSKAGGQQTLSGFPSFDGMNALDGSTFDNGFDADYYLTLFIVDSDFVSPGTVQPTLFVDFVDIQTDAGTKIFLGAATQGAGGVLSNGDPGAPTGILVAWDNSNLAGVGGAAGQNTGGESVGTGIELAIPVSVLGSGIGSVKASAAINGSSHDFLSNQVLGGLGGGQGNLAAPPFDFTLITGDQYFEMAGPAGVLEQVASVLSSSGAWVTNTTQATVYVLAEAAPGGVSHQGRFTHYGGFLGGAILRPDDVNPAGLPYEMDPDNDSDGLFDEAEVSGSAFEGHASSNPDAWDTDGDGMGDADEAAGMFDPNDPEHRLAVIEMADVGTHFHMEWIGKGGETVNRVLWGTDAVTNVLYSGPFPGGIFPWYKITNSLAWPKPVDPMILYGVEIER